MAVKSVSGPLIATALLLAACAGPGTLDGAAPAAGSTRPGLGATLAAVLATEAGRGLDERDRALAADAEFDALQFGVAGTAREWKNPTTGHLGGVTPGPAYSVNQITCRDYTHRLEVGTRPELVRGTACRQADGSWRPLG